MRILTAGFTVIITTYIAVYRPRVAKTGPLLGGMPVLEPLSHDQTSAFLVFLLIIFWKSKRSDVNDWQGGVS